MKLKMHDVWIDGIAYEDEVGDHVLYPANLETGELYTISVIDESDEHSVMYTLIAEEDGAVIRVPFDDTIHVESQIELCKFQVMTHEALKTLDISDSYKFLERFSK